MDYKIKPQSFILPLVAGGIGWFFTENVAVGAALCALFCLPTIISIYIPYAEDNPEQYWFKRKLYGWGWTPVTWQGWFITLAYIALVIAFALTLDENSPTREVVFTFVLPVSLLTITFLRIAYKTGERPKWQWGRSDGD